MRRRVLPFIRFACVALAIAAPHRSAAQQQSVTDPFIWLEDVESKQSLDWVHAKNAATEAILAKTPLYQPIFDRTRQILDSKDRIAMPRIIGDRIYNFWQDADHTRGIWRRTSWADYLTGAPTWETVIDLDTLSKAEHTTFSIGAITCFEPEDKRCLVGLSRGGSDAAEVRELDLASGRFLSDGFTLPAAKSSVAWVDENTLLIGTDFGPGSMTTSGYARIIKRWTRGTPLSSATTVHEAPADHMGVFAASYDAGGRRYVRVEDYTSFYTSDKYLLVNGALVKLDVPNDADVHFLRDQMSVYVRDPWTTGGTTWGTGSLVAMPVDDFMRGTRDLALVFKPGPTETVRDISATRDHLLVSMLDNVRGALRRYSHTKGAWTFEKVPAPDMGTVDVSATSTSANNFFFTYTSFIQPTTLYLSNGDGKITEVKRMPAMFDA
ncbi:MAG: S9 family peptidase, partial [Gemmatimonadaceae bacterium]